MQQVCNNCRYPLQPGAAVCTNCGTPVSAAGGGPYAPGTGYGQPPYGAPVGSDSYSDQYSAPPGGGYGVPPSDPYGAPQANQYGAPQAPIFTPVAVQPKSRRGVLFGAIGLLVVCIVGVVLVVNVFGKFKQTISTGTHITKIQVGTALDQNTFEITSPADTFHTGDKVYVSFTVVTQDSGAQVTLKLYAGSTLEDTDTVTPDPGTTIYGNSVVVQNTGEHTIEVDYNGSKEASITFNVTS